jgi:integrase
VGAAVYHFSQETPPRRDGTAGGGGVFDAFGGGGPCRGGHAESELNAIVFLYKELLKRDLGQFEHLVWAKRNPRVPVVLTIDEVKAVLGHQDVSTTMIYTHVLKQGGLGVKSPLDLV